LKLFGGKKAKTKTKDKTTVVAVDTAHVQPVLPIQPPPSAINDSVASLNRLIADIMPLWKKRISYKTFSGKAKVHFEGPDNKIDFTAHIRLQKDKIIWINVTALGGMVQAARIYITPDSFFMINYQQKEITRLPLSDVAKVLPTKIDFASLQNLIIGEPLREGNITYAANSAGTWSIQVEDEGYIQHLAYNKVDSTMRSEQMRTRGDNGPMAKLDFGDYQTINSRRIATGRAINIQNGESVLSLDMNFQNTDFDTELEFPFSVPKNYTIKER